MIMPAIAIAAKVRERRKLPIVQASPAAREFSDWVERNEAIGRLA